MFRWSRWRWNTQREPSARSDDKAQDESISALANQFNLRQSCGRWKTSSVNLYSYYCLTWILVRTAHQLLLAAFWTCAYFKLQCEMTSFHLFEDAEHRHVRFGLILQTHHRSLFCWTFWGTIKQPSLIMWVKWRHGVMTVFLLLEWVKAPDLYCYINSITHINNIRTKLVIKKTVGLASIIRVWLRQQSFGCTGEVQALAHSWSSFKGWVDQKLYRVNHIYWRYITAWENICFF